MRTPAHVGRRHVAVATAGCAALAVVGLVDPSRTTLGPPCPLRAITGLDCPLCGATRATHELLRGDLVAALDLNALYVVALPAIAVLVLVWLRRGRLPEWASRASTAWSAVAVAVAFAVARNLPFGAVDVLSTTVTRQ